MNMKRFDVRIIFGFLLLIGGALALMQALGYLKNASDIFWGGAFIAVGLVFLSLLFSGNWWSVFPGFTLLAIGVSFLLPNMKQDFGGALFLGSIALAFWVATPKVARRDGGAWFLQGGLPPLQVLP